MNTDRHDEAIRHIKEQNCIKEIMQYICFIAVVGVFLLLMSTCDPDAPAAADTADMPTPLPMIDGDWHRQGRVYIMELAHGWLVKRSPQDGGGMCFVPRPGKD
jgi:hypothetical protein